MERASPLQPISQMASFSSLQFFILSLHSFILSLFLRNRRNNTRRLILFPLNLELRRRRPLATLKRLIRHQRRFRFHRIRRIFIPLNVRILRSAGLKNRRFRLKIFPRFHLIRQLLEFVETAGGLENLAFALLAAGALGAPAGAVVVFFVNYFLHSGDF